MSCDNRCLPFASDNGTIVPMKDRYNEGDVVQMFCSQGFDVTGDQAIVCGSTGSWLGQIPRCSPIDQRGCLPFTRATDDGTIVPVKDMYNEGDVVQLFCRQGFDVIGDQAIVCGSTGSWLGQIPRCSPIDQGGCLPLTTPTDEGTVIPMKDRYNEGDVVQMFCRQGFDVTGDQAIVCGSSGSWQGQIPRCSPSDQGDQWTLIIGIAAGGVFLFFILVIVIVVSCRRGRKTDHPIVFAPSPDKSEAEDALTPRPDTRNDISLDNMGYASLGADVAQPTTYETLPETST
ncbi:complement component receptor 1-like protein [Amphiura filiformis]|uniref:complement component receptor 1-like protein n=1 Tax=Amphiura filiformis TaxID=82378 RepID=UPI003B213837